jgi:hypothetical protein
MGEMRGAYRVLVGRPEGKNHLENLGIDEMIRQALNMMGAYTGLMWLGMGTYNAFVNAVMNVLVP